MEYYAQEQPLHSLPPGLLLVSDAKPLDKPLKKFKNEIIMNIGIFTYSFQIVLCVCYHEA